ncbi:MAG: phosphate/phosphite/phosphonate ABC transporter substrate-binding protein [Candidatus Thiodiazotropha sp. (ex Notomyrtea botanica)]|nr:phosphate/phosphite/phosphonate ABC transporter substrate-binding protein [Candidatus Thiodiazotropha sp. (ex Notomyrtea botanica)]
MKSSSITSFILYFFFAFPIYGDADENRYDSNPDTGYFGRMDKILFDANATDTTIATDMIIRDIFGLMDMKSEIKVFDRRDLLIKNLSENRIDAVFVNIIDFIELEHLINPDFLYTLIYGQTAEQKVYLLTRKSDDITDVSHLKGNSISIPKGHYLGMRFLEVLLMKEGLPTIDNHFSQTLETIDTNTAIINLFFGKSDCALVSDIAFELASELNPQIKNTLTVTATSEPMVPQIIAINKNVPAKLTKKVDNYLVKSHKNIRIKHLLSLFRAKRFVKLNKESIYQTRTLLDEYNKLSNLTSSNHQ